MDEKMAAQLLVEVKANGPFIVKNIALLLDSDEKPIASNKKVYALCRCGKSGNKPFCDGTHAKIGFSGKRELNKPIDREKRYVGKSITIHDNRRICAHVAECINLLPAVFDTKKQPWINADGADKEQIIKTIKKCPSGALSYSIDGVHFRNKEKDPKIKIAKNGPLEVSGPVELIDPEQVQPANVSGYTLCRCGASANKPFCDGSHHRIGFKDDR
jgi:CDGSH-type Zn-finger protein